VFVGSTEQFVDEVVEWFEASAVDGFNIMPPWFPGGLEIIVEGVIPELQRRGIFRTEYEGTTLRDHLGLKRPPNRFSAVDHRSSSLRGSPNLVSTRPGQPSPALR
jgi:hypothetical protein